MTVSSALPINPDWWPVVMADLPRPLSREAALLDLRWWARSPFIPGRVELARRWGWTQWAVRELVGLEDEWSDPGLPGRRRQRPNRRTPTIAQPPPARTRPPEPRKYAPSKDRPPQLDLGRRSGDVLAIARRHDLYAQCVRAGWDRDDLDQELLVRILARQAGRSRYDPERAGLGKYLWVSTRTILSQLLLLVTRPKATSMQLGTRVMREGATVEVDAALAAVADPWNETFLDPDPPPEGGGEAPQGGGEGGRGGRRGGRAM